MSEERQKWRSKIDQKDGKAWYSIGAYPCTLIELTSADDLRMKKTLHANYHTNLFYYFLFLIRVWEERDWRGKAECSRIWKLGIDCKNVSFSCERKLHDVFDVAIRYVEQYYLPLLLIIWTW